MIIVILCKNRLRRIYFRREPARRLRVRRDTRFLCFLSVRRLRLPPSLDPLLDVNILGKMARILDTMGCGDVIVIPNVPSIILKSFSVKLFGIISLYNGVTVISLSTFIFTGLPSSESVLNT